MPLRAEQIPIRPAQCRRGENLIAFYHRRGNNIRRNIGLPEMLAGFQVSAQQLVSRFGRSPAEFVETAGILEGKDDDEQLRVP